MSFQITIQMEEREAFVDALEEGRKWNFAIKICKVPFFMLN